MRKEIVLGRAVVRTLNRIPRNTRELILDKVRQYADDPAALANNVKRLQGYSDRYRIRVGDWRVIFDDEGNVLLVVEVVPRGGAYRPRRHADGDAPRAGV